MRRHYTAWKQKYHCSTHWCVINHCCMYKQMLLGEVLFYTRDFMHAVKEQRFLKSACKYFTKYRKGQRDSYYIWYNYISLYIIILLYLYYCNDVVCIIIV